MGFADCAPDLSGWCFGEPQLARARAVLCAALARYDPRWLKKPIGPLGAFWRADGPASVAHVIDLARVMDTLQSNVTQKSTAALWRKFQELLRAKSPAVYEERLTELQVAAHLIERSSPIAFDPLVPERLLDSPRRPPSPDFAIRLPGGDVFLEATVLRVGGLLEWDRSMEALTQEITRWVLGRFQRRLIDLSFPWSYRSGQLSAAQKRTLRRQLCERDSGTLILDLASGPATATWGPLPHLGPVDVGAFGGDTMPAEVYVATFGEVTTPAAASRRWVREGTAPSDLLLRAIRNTLKRKRKQFPHEAPYLLVVKLGHHRIRPDGLRRLLETRIWPNAEYGWISGLCLFTPRVDFRVTGAPPSLMLNANPEARRPCSAALLALFEGVAQYHIGRGPS